MRGLFASAFLAVTFPLAAQNPAPAAQGALTREAVQERLSKNTGSEIPDLSGLDLRRLDLSGLDFRQANLMKARLDSANLSGAKLFAVNLTDASAIGAIDPAVSPRLHDRLQEVAVSAPRTGPQALGIVLAFVLLAAGVVGASIGVGALVAPRIAVAPSPALAAEPGDVVAWSTDVAQLRAGSFGIEADGRVFDAPAGADVTSDPGNLEAWTLETRWRDAGVEQAMTLYFAADETHWWVPELWVRDGSVDGPGAKADWVTFKDVVARTPLGQPFRGDIDLVATAATGPVKVHLGDVRIAVHPNDPINEPIGGTRKLLVENGVPAINGDPFGPGGPLHCSGILQLPPQAAEARPREPRTGAVQRGAERPARPLRATG